MLSLGSCSVNQGKSNIPASEVPGIGVISWEWGQRETEFLHLVVCSKPMAHGIVSQVFLSA